MGGGSKTTEVKIPQWLEDAAKAGLARADTVSRIPYAPYYGPDVAAMTPAQIASMQGTNTAASAFGLQTSDPMAGVPQATNYNGMMAYSSGSGYDAALKELKRRQPGTYKAITGQFINPITGQMPAGATASGGAGASAGANSTVPTTQRREGGGGRDGDRSGVGGAPRSGASGGYTGIRDMFDGGGPGRSGDKFSGGPLSGAANRAGISPVGRDGGGGMGRGK